MIVDAKAVNDNGSAKLARDIAAEIRGSLNFPGEVKVTVLREGPPRRVRPVRG